jgi:hypothetical protein
VYPPRNPFPAQATTIIEGASAEDLTQLTLARPSIERLIDLASRYHTSYDPAYDDNGRAIAVHGDHGSGKTHALATAMASLGAGCADGVWSIYVRADSPDIFSLYRKLMSQVSFPQLRDLCVQAREQYAREEFADSRDLGADALRVALETSEVDGDWVARAFSDTELQATAVLDRQSRDLVREGGRQKDFERVIPNILNRDLDELAYRWFTGEQLPDGDLRALGITENIDDSFKIRMAIHALLTLSRRAAQAAVILIDQTEALLSSDGELLIQDNVGTLRAILESVINNSGLLIIAIRESIWHMLPLDLRQRFGPSEIPMTGITEREATDLVALFVARWSADEKLNTYPILQDGIREMLVRSGGNIRRFIQLCSLLFTVAAPRRTLIDGKFAHDVLSSQAEVVPTKDTIRRELVEQFAAAHIPYQIDYSLSDVRTDFAVSDAAGGFRAFILLTDALVDSKELDIAQRTLDLVYQAQNQARPAEIVLIVGGYMSPELTVELSKVHRVIVITRDTDRRELATLVADLSRSESAATDLETTVLERLSEAIDAITAIEADRERQWKSVAPQVNVYNEAMSDRRRVDETLEAAGQWRTQEEGLREGIHTARRDRQRLELDELERQRSISERYRRRLYALLSMPFLLGAAALAVLASGRYGVPQIDWPAALILAVFSVLSPLAIFRVYQVREGDLRNPVHSASELTRLTRGHLAESPAPRLGIAALRSTNPQIIYAAGFAQQKYPVSALKMALARTKSAIARRSLVRKLVADHGIEGFRAVLDTIGSDPATSAAFDQLDAEDYDLLTSFDANSETGSELEQPDEFRSDIKAWLPINIAVDLTPQLRAVARIYGFAIHDRESDLLADFIQPRLHSGKRGAPAAQLRESYDRDRDDLLLSTLPIFTEREFRAAAATLSPFDVGMAGSFDWLTKFIDVEEMYLFFRKCLFYVGRGIPTKLP